MVFERTICKGVILAAGDGGRLGRHTVSCPKVLLPVNGGGSLISYPIKALVTAGITQIAVVVGYLGDEVKRALGDGSRFGAELHYVPNYDYLGGNAVSVHKVMRWAEGDPVVLCMGDHLISRKIVRLLLDTDRVIDTLCVDYRPPRLINVSEATKVGIDDNDRIKDIGKDLVYWDAIDTGVFLLTEKFFRVLDELVALSGPGLEMNTAIRAFINRGHNFVTCDISGCSWMDVDTEEDLRMARR